MTGLATVLLMLGLGRILGATGHIFGLVFEGHDDEVYRRTAPVADPVPAPMKPWAKAA